MKINILIVEDEKEIREGVSEYLSEVGYNVISAEDGMQAIELFKNSKIDLVILDIMLPKANGFVVLNKIRQESNVPVIMLTAMSDDYTQIMSFDEKADDYITKPFSIIVLHKRIEALLRRGVKVSENKKWCYGDIEIDFEGYSARNDAPRGSKGRDGGSSRAIKENGAAQRDGSAKGKRVDSGKHPSAVASAVHAKAAGRSTAAAAA